MWEIEEYERAGMNVLIFYFVPEGETIPEGQDRTIYTRGQIICHDKKEVELWRTVLTTLNSTEE